MELMGASQSTFRRMVSDMGLAAAMGPKTEYTLLAPDNAAFTSELFPRKPPCGPHILSFPNQRFNED